MSSEVYDVIFIGGGPAGYVGAIRARQLGLKTALVEHGEFGGVCLNEGCIPSKILLRRGHQIRELQDAVKIGVLEGEADLSVEGLQKELNGVMKKSRRGIEGLLEQHGVDYVSGVGSVARGTPHRVDVACNDGSLTYRAENIVLATGARPRVPESLLKHHDRKTGMTSKEIFFLDEIPEHILIVGGGVIGVEMADAFHDFGAEVTIVEMAPRLLSTLVDEDIAGILEKSFKKRGINVFTDAKLAIERTDVYSVKVSVGENETFLESVSHILFATGTSPNVENLGLEEAGVVLEERGNFIHVNQETFETTVRGIYAVGDVNGLSGLAHAASAEAVNVAERIAGRNPAPIDFNTIPYVVYTNPSIAGFGYLEEDVEDALEIKVGRFSLANLGRAVAFHVREGSIKVLIDTQNGNRLVGAHAIGADVEDRIASMAIFAALEGDSVALEHALAPHPSLTEAFFEAMADVSDGAIHTAPKSR